MAIHINCWAVDRILDTDFFNGLDGYRNALEGRVSPKTPEAVEKPLRALFVAIDRQARRP